MLFLIDTTAAANKRSMKLDQQRARLFTTKKRFYSLTFFLCTLDSYLMTDLRMGIMFTCPPKL